MVTTSDSPGTTVPCLPRHRWWAFRRIILLVIGLSAIAGLFIWWQSGSRLRKLADHTGSFHLTSLRIKTTKGTKVLTDPEGLKYLEDRIVKGTIPDHLSLGDHDRWLRQWDTVESKWTFSDLGVEDRSMKFSAMGMAIQIPGNLHYGLDSKPPFLHFYKFPDTLEVSFDEQAPPSITEFIEPIGQINLPEE